MPFLLKYKDQSDNHLGLWKLEDAEDENYFIERLELSEEESTYFATLKARRRLEYLASRYSLHLLTRRKQRAICLKDEYGKPYIADSSHKISFSHSNKMIAVYASPQDCGVDIQLLVSKISRIAHKFISEKESLQIDENHTLLYQHFFWGAKEALFKAYGRNNVDFLKHLEVAIELFDKDRFTGKGYVRKQDYEAAFRLEAKLFDQHLLVTATEIK